MIAISSHRDHRSSKMRFLIVSAVLACAAAAPSHLLQPVAVAPAVVPVASVVPVAYSAAVPTLSPGDVQAAAIDAQVQARDLAIAAADKARELSEKSSENLTEKLVTDSDQIKENNQEAFWSVQEKQWQAIDALKTAEAQLDGAIASNAPILAKNAVLPPFIAAVPAITPLTYAQGVAAPLIKSEAAKEEIKEKKNEAITKTAEENKSDDSVAIEASKENIEAKPQIAPIIAFQRTPIAIPQYTYPIVAPVSLAPIQYSTFPQVGLAPTIVKTVW